MAIDVALLHSVQAGAAPAVRFYQWSPACLSFGRNQVTRGVYDPQLIRTAGIDVVRRSTGGLAVLHDREITYSVAAPAALLGGPRQSYEAINRALVMGLEGLGVSAHLAAGTSEPTRPESLHPCFQAPGAGEVVVDGVKLVGSAQRCERRTLLQHGSVLLDGDQASLVAYQVTPVRTDGGGTTLKALLGRAPEPYEVVRALVAGFETMLGTRLAHCTLSEGERVEAAMLEEQYDAPEWTWRR